MEFLDSRAMRILSGMAAAAVLGLAPARVWANCATGGSPTAVTVLQAQASTLPDLMASSTPPCTITVGPGLYPGGPKPTAGINGDSIFYVRFGITVVSSGGASVTTLQVPAGQGYGLMLVTTNGGVPSGATVQGFTITGGLGGILVRDFGGGVVDNVTLRGLVVNSDFANVGAGHGIDFLGVTNSVIDFVSVNRSRNNGIFLEPGTGVNIGNTGNIVMNSTVAGSDIQYDLAMQGGNDNIIVNNTFNTIAGQGGLSMNAIGTPSSPVGCLRNRIERNTFSNYVVDGIVLTAACNYNYVIENVLTTDAYNAVSQNPPTRLSGVGLWLNNASNGNYVFGNDMSGSPESGMAVFMASNNYIEANRVHGNEDGGIIVKNDNCCLSPFAPTGVGAPTGNVLHSNLTYFNGRSSIGGTQILELGSTSNDIAYNFMTGRSGFLGSQRAGTNTTGLSFQGFGGTVSSANKAYENTIDEVEASHVVQSDTLSTRIYRNRHLRANFVGGATGSEGIRYSIVPADVKWDADVSVGGNFWNDHPASGNPSAVTPFKGFVYDAIHGLDGNGPYVDRYPFQSEHLGRGYSILSVTEPYAGQVIASQSKKTISWLSTGCVFVDLTLQPGSLPIVQNYPDIGHYVWDVPVLTPAVSYTVQVQCKDSTGAAQAPAGTSGAFVAGTSSLFLMSPSRDDRLMNGALGPTRVAWRSTAAVTGVNIYVRLGGTEQLVASNAQGSFVNITLPSFANASNQTTIRIEAANLPGQHRDSVDGYLLVRGVGPTAQRFTTVLAGASLRIGTIQPIRWVGRADAYTVDLDLMEGATSVQAIARNLPDVGHYTWLVPEYWSSASFLRATFRNGAGTVMGTADSGVFKVLYTTTPGIVVNRFRLFNNITAEHHFPTDANEYNFLSTNFPGIWVGEGVSMQMYNGPINVGGVEAVPYYRLYQKVQQLHFWTTSRNEYFLIREAFPTLYNAEGVDGYLFPTQVFGSIPLYRLLFKPRDPVHLWTVTQNEHDVLLASPTVWGDEGIDGYVYPPP
jgi:parallel beta-helix repeat protein